MVRLSALGSGSKGNALVLSCGDGSIIVDVRFSRKETCCRLRTLGLNAEEIKADDVPAILVYNKIDNTALEPEIVRHPDGRPKAVFVSALTGEGLDLLRQAIGEFAHQWRVDNPNEPRAPEPWEEEVAHDLVALADDNIEDFLVRKKKR